ncbi:hypothetical protein HO345_01455 [Treponema denticola]|uniref:hypothetical protein n=1 Tax=Treponema denticola TaxID=158 RepID=UPI0020A3BDFE|nr:hypothetical protein [Treponema denticola]UTD11738.1 hypothetical protein HO345_01455 [Treponema denticola]
MNKSIFSTYHNAENRYFMQTRYMGFYAEQSIQPLFPEIIGFVESLILNDDAALDQAGVKTCMGKREEVIERLREFKKNYPKTDPYNGTPCKYIVLAKKEDTSRVVSIKAPIKNENIRINTAVNFYIKNIHQRLSKLQRVKITAVIEHILQSFVCRYCHTKLSNQCIDSSLHPKPSFLSHIPFPKNNV